MKEEVTVGFIDNKIRNSFEKLKKMDKKLYKLLDRAFDDIKKDYTIGEKRPIKSIKKEFIKKWGLDETRNIWVYDLPSAWRLLYTIRKEEVIVLAIILDWMNHDAYMKIYKDR